MEENLKDIEERIKKAMLKAFCEFSTSNFLPGGTDCWGGTG